MAHPVTDAKFFRIAEMAEDAGLRVEISRDLPIWELMPSPMHMLDAEAISQTIRPGRRAAEIGCGCHHIRDVAIRFPDGSLRRPDISVFCTRPPRTRQATTVIPTAVIEVVSPTSVMKDTQISPPFYLSHGVQDVFVYDPEALTVRHFHGEKANTFSVPADFETESGCIVGFPRPPEDPEVP
jgi:hypothetical protein